MIPKLPKMNSLTKRLNNCFNEMKKINVRKILIRVAVLVIIFVALTGGAIADRIFKFKPLDYLFPRKEVGFSFSQKVVSEESVVIDVVEKVSPSVVTVSIQTPKRRILEFNPFEGFSTRIGGGEPQDIGTGFIVSEDGLVVTNKHVVSVTGANYKVITKDNKEYEIKQISRDPSNDIAVVKIDAKGLKPIKLGNSDNIKVGQFAIAIGTALGEFRNTVTIGVVSGLGRGITAGSAFEGYVERLDNVIQTDAAINLGNSGGPLINSAGQAIGINVAVAQGANNIGFAIPINVVKEALGQYRANGKFAAKAYLGIRYQMLEKQTAILNNVPQGAYVVEVISASPADKAGIKEDDIITKIDGEDVNTEKGLAGIIAKKKSGDTVSIELWREQETIKLSVTLSEFTE
jgi:S1-C subfamily serine protease